MPVGVSHWSLIPRKPPRLPAPLMGGSARKPEVRAPRRRRRLHEGYHILEVLGLQVGVGIVIESTLGKPLHQRSEILAHYVSVKLRKHAARLLEIGRELRVGVQAIANLLVVPDPSEAL